MNNNNDNTIGYYRSLTDQQWSNFINIPHIIKIYLIQLLRKSQCNNDDNFITIIKEEGIFTNKQIELIENDQKIDHLLSMGFNKNDIIEALFLFTNPFVHRIKPKPATITINDIISYITLSNNEKHIKQKEMISIWLTNLKNNQLKIEKYAEYLKGFIIHERILMMKNN